MSKLFFFLPIVVIWFLSLGFSQFEITLLLSSFFLSATISEIPAGLFSDRVGHKWALLVCGLTEAVGMVLLAYASDFWMALLGEVLNGIGYAFYTGSKEAYLFNYLKVSGEEHLYQKNFARAKLFEFIGMALAALVGGSIYVLWNRLPFLLTAAAFFLSAIVAILLSEPTLKKEGGESGLNHLLQGIREIRSGPPDLKVLIGYYCVFLSAVLIFLITLNQPFLKEAGVPIAYFGVVFLLFHVASMGGSELAHHLPIKFVTPRFFLFMGISLTLGLIGLGFLRHPLAILLIIFIHLIWGLFFPTTSQATNRLIDTKMRATILATQDFLQNLLFVVVAPLLGLATDAWGLSVAIWMLAGIAGLTVLLPLRLKKEQLP